MTYVRVHFAKNRRSPESANVSHSAELVSGRLCRRVKAPSSALLAEGKRPI
jgi:hypothetical protein